MCTKHNSLKVVMLLHYRESYVLVPEVKVLCKGWVGTWEKSNIILKGRHLC